MKLIRSSTRTRRNRRGFSLVEATLTIGIFSFGLLSMAPLLAVGMKSARQARDNRTAADIAQTLTEDARQGTLTAGTNFLDAQGNACGVAQAAYQTEATFSPVTGTQLSRLKLRIIPVGAPTRVRTYAVVFAAPQ